MSWFAQLGTPRVYYALTRVNWSSLAWDKLKVRFKPSVTVEMWSSEENKNLEGCDWNDECKSEK
jgi:hypothetical protein